MKITKPINSDFVLDCSVTMAWCFEDEANTYAESILDQWQEGVAIVPTIWPLEVANVLLMAERKKRINKIKSATFKNALSSLPITVDHTSHNNALNTIIELARKTKLSVYDAAYLEIALNEEIPICSLDKALVKAAKDLKIQVLQ